MVGLGLTWRFCWALGPLFAGKCSGAGPTASAITRLDGNANPGPPKLRGYMGGQKKCGGIWSKIGRKSPIFPRSFGGRRQYTPQNSGTNLWRTIGALAHYHTRDSPGPFRRATKPGFPVGGATKPYDFLVENERMVRSGRAAIIAATSVNTITLWIGSDVSDCK